MAAAFLLAAGTAAAQPSAPDPDGDQETPPAHAAAPDFGPQSPEEEAARRRDRLETLFERLAAADGNGWQSAQTEIRRIWTQSGSASMDLLLRRAHKAVEEEEDPELALRFLDDFVRLDADFAEAWNMRATVHFMLGEYGRSVADIERTLALEPRHFGALTGLGAILERVGDREGAFRAYNRALEIHPNLEKAAEAVERLRPHVEGRKL